MRVISAPVRFPAGGCSTIRSRTEPSRSRSMSSPETAGKAPKMRRATLTLPLSRPWKEATIRWHTGSGKIASRAFDQPEMVEAAPKTRLHSVRVVAPGKRLHDPRHRISPVFTRVHSTPSAVGHVRPWSLHPARASDSEGGTTFTFTLPWAVAVSIDVRCAQGSRRRARRPPSSGRRSLPP